MKVGPHRLPTGGRIDRLRPLAFTFDGQPLTGFAGDTLASALLANRVRSVSRSMKFRRPRGVFSSGIEEPNALVQLGTGGQAVPSARATVVVLTDGLNCFSQSGWPGVRFDVLRLLDAGARLFAAGFYNKTFMWPGWNWFEPAIRRLAGLGRCPEDADPSRYDVRNAHGDVLIVGGGVAGLSTALAATRERRRVWLVEQENELGGYARWGCSSVEGLPSGQWIAAAVRELRESRDCRILTRTTAVGSYDHGVVALNEQCQDAGPIRERLWILRVRRLILATGAIEQPLIFEHNDRPGIMLAGAARRFLAEQAIAVGNRVLISTNNDSAYLAALELARASVKVVCLTDSRSQTPHALTDSLRRAGVPVHAGTIPVSTAGFSRLRRVTLGRLVNAGKATQSHHVVSCDALLVSGGWSPALQLFAQSGGKLAFNDTSRTFVPQGSLPNVQVVGAAAETGEVGPRTSPTGRRWRQWVDLRHDVTVADLHLAIQENYHSIEHIKRYTTVGMSVDQGKTSTAATTEMVAQALDCAPSSLGHTTFRPPVTPVTLGAFAGRQTGALFAAWRETPLHECHLQWGASMEDYGDWRRAAWYPKPGESRAQAIVREARLVRTNAGLFDASPLGKIEIHGQDAREFVDRFYINRLDTLALNRARYGLMLRDNGVIFDDGIVALSTPQRVFVTTTSGNALRVAAWLEEWRQCEWPSLHVAIIPVTEQWATIALTGPNARAVLEKVKPACSTGNEAFPYLAFQETTLLGEPARIYRVSFSGELTFEINVPAHAGRRVWETILAAGSDEGLEPIGVEALLHLRLEKGFLHIGTDTDGSTVPDDVGWGRAAAAKTRDFIGKRSLLLPENQRSDRLQLVGLTRLAGERLRVGAHVRLQGTQIGSDGWITSSGDLLSDGSSIALALIRAGRSRMGSVVSVHDAGVNIASASVVAAQFYDPGGVRMNG